jgi:hypothetical protein
MPDDELFNSLEERLRDDARELLGEAPPKSLIVEFHDTFKRRRRRRRIVQAFGVASAAVLVGLAGVRWLHWQGHDDKTQPVAATHVDIPTKHTPQAGGPLGSIVLRPARNAQTPRPGALAIGVWVARPRPDGKTELVPGLYVPEQTTPIDSQDWSPAERLAVSRLLGPQANFSHHKTI